MRTKCFALSVMRPSAIPHGSETQPYAACEDRARRPKPVLEVFPVENVFRLPVKPHTDSVTYRHGVVHAQVGPDRAVEFEGSTRERKKVASVCEHIEDHVQSPGDLLCCEQRERMAWLHEGSQKPGNGGRNAVDCVGERVGRVQV